MIPKNVLSRLLATVLLLWAGVCMADQPAASSHQPAPKAVVPSATFEFAPVVDGTEIQHDFTILNKGDAPLDILKVRTA